jgi:hypothetical protein
MDHDHLLCLYAWGPVDGAGVWFTCGDLYRAMGRGDLLTWVWVWVREVYLGVWTLVT